MEKTKLSYSVSRTLTEENVKDILTTAIEGGIGYWATLDNSHKDWEEARNACAIKMGEAPCYCDTAYEVLSCGKSIYFIDSEADDLDNPGEDELWELTMDKFIEGCKLWENWSKRNLVKAVEDGDFDADDADVLIQYALFGDIIYG